MNLQQIYKISNKFKSIDIALKDLPLWILLYDEKINDVIICESHLWDDFIFCKYAVTQNGLCLQYIKNQSIKKLDELCALAVNQNGFSLEFVPANVMSYNLCFSAVKECRFAIKYVPEIFQSEELCMMAIKGKTRKGLFGFNVKDMLTNSDPEFMENGFVLRYMTKQTIKICKYALESTPDSYIYIQNKTPELDLHRQKCILKIEKDSEYYENYTKMLGIFT